MRQRYRPRSTNRSRPKDMNTSWREDGSIESVGQLMVVISFVGGGGVWLQERGILNHAAFWLILMGVAILGMRLAGRQSRRELAQRQKEAQERSTAELRDQEELDACRRRQERRDSIRAGEIEDDGLSDHGRQLAEKPQFAKVTRDFEALGVSFASATEDIFESEKRDQKLEAAWKRKVAADAAWEKLRSRR
jgi:hypothetical protein